MNSKHDASDEEVHDILAHYRAAARHKKQPIADGAQATSTEEPTAAPHEPLEGGDAE